MNTFTLTSPLAVSKWDALSMHVSFVSRHPANIDVGSAQLIPATQGQGVNTLAEKCYYQLNVANPARYTIASMTLIPNAGCVVIGAYMAPPQVVGIGDSFLCTDAPEPCDSVSDYWAPSFPMTSSVGYGPPHFWLANFGMVPTYQGMSWAGQTATGIAGRFTTDLVDLQPAYGVIDGGMNDLNDCENTGCTEAQITAIEQALASMFSACRSNGIQCLYLLMGPWQGAKATNAIMANEDTVNAWSLANAPAYGVVPIDLRCWIGKFRPGGSTGNCWNWRSQYEFNLDGMAIHWNQSGARLIGNNIFTLFPTFWNLSGRDSSAVAPRTGAKRR